MDNNVKRKIARGVRKAAQRRRMSEAMKKSWERRRNSPLDLPLSKTHVYTDDDLLEVAITLIGRENVRTLLVNAIKGVLL
jgi:hypothetical protein